MKSRSFNQGYDTLEYMSSALLDMEWHSLPADAPLQDVQKFEAAALKKTRCGFSCSTATLQVDFLRSRLLWWLFSQLLCVYVE